MKKDNSATIVQLVAIDETGDSYYRMRWPARELAEQAPDWRVINLDARANERFEWGEEADLLVVYQSHDLDLLPMMRRRKAAGKKTLVEYNDNFYSPPPSTPVAEAWSSPILWQTYERFMHESDGVIVTGPGLQELLSQKTKAPIHILENHIPQIPQKFEKLWQEPEDRIRIGMAGSLGHMPDYLAVLPTLRELFDRFPELELHVMGNEALPQIIGLPAERMKFTPWGSMDQYFEFLKPLHIGIAPLLDTPYNRCRSDVKALEISACGAMPLLTRAFPYANFLERTQSPAFSSFAELVDVISRIVADRSSLREAAKRCYDYVKAERIGPKRDERRKLYDSVLPGNKSKFAWRQSYGSHEVTGTLNDTPTESKLLIAAQELIGKGDRAAALVLLQEALAANPDMAGAAYAELKVLGATSNDQAWLARLQVHLQRFPDDLRFRILFALRERDPERLLTTWSVIGGKLRAAPPAYRNFFKTPLLAAFLEQLSKEPLLLPIAELFISVYPNHAALRFATAQILERVGRTAHAAEHVRWLIEARDTAMANADFNRSMDAPYLQCWADSLDGRIALEKKV